MTLTVERVAPTVMSVGCGQAIPSGGPAFDRLSDRWRLRIIQTRMVLRARHLTSCWCQVTFAVGAPGCGKTAGGLFFFWELMAAGLARYVVWIVPNETLLTQVQDAVKEYLGPMYKIAVGMNADEDCINPEDPFCIGVVITYQMLNQPTGGSDNAAEMWIDRLRKTVAGANRVGRPGGVLLAWDECHHLADTLEQFSVIDTTSPPPSDQRKLRSRPWCAVAHKMHHELVVVDGGHSLLATGTPDREDGCALPIATYCDEREHDPDRNAACAGTMHPAPDDNQDGSLVSVGKTASVPHVHVECSYAEAYGEGSLKMPEPLPCPANVEYIEDGNTESTPNRTDDDRLTERETRDSIYTALSIPNYWQPAVCQPVAHWREYRANTFDFWQLLAILKDQRMAAEVAAYMLTRLAVKVGLAISCSGKHGKAAMAIWEAAGGQVETGRVALERFKAGEYEALATVAMATEGYDVPRISHLLFHSDCRTLGYCIQAFTRGCRTCREAEAGGMPSWTQSCFISTLADSIATDYIERLRSNLGLVRASVVGHMKLSDGDEEGPGGKHARRITPVAAELVLPLAYRRSAPPKPTQVIVVDRAAADDARRREDLRKWTRGASALSVSLNKKFPGWRKFGGEKLGSVWTFVKEYISR